MLTIWAATSLAARDWIYPWPVWMTGPWGAVLLVQSVTGVQGGSAGRDRQWDRHPDRELRRPAPAPILGRTWERGPSKGAPRVVLRCGQGGT
ncbi:MAG: uncharacterized protein JWQ26_3416 [Modestobacter sp.]|nr:uncharacterized protein [Modestobacter sp.]